MSSGVACECPGTRKEKMKHWGVVDYKCNYSAFNGYHFTPSDYSQVVCTNLQCQGTWRTKAKYVYGLPQAELINGTWVKK